MHVLACDLNKTKMFITKMTREISQSLESISKWHVLNIRMFLLLFLFQTRDSRSQIEIKMTSEFKRGTASLINPQLLIIEHFDSIVNELDIFVESLIESSENVKNYCRNRRRALSTKQYRIDCMNQARSRLIDEIRRVEEVVMSYCGENRAVLRRKLGEMAHTEKHLAISIKREIFSNTSVCFLVYLNTNELRSNVFIDRLLNVFLVVVERMYLDLSDIKFIRFFYFLIF